MNSIKYTVFYALAIFSVQQLSGQSGDNSPDPIDADVNKIKESYNDKWAAIQARGDAMKNDNSGSGVSKAIEWEDKVIEFDLPNIQMKTTQLSFDTPTVDVVQQTISWDVPEIRMVQTKIGQYPVFHANQGYNATVEWKDITTNIPQVFPHRQEATVGIPQIHNNRVQIELDLPEVTWSQLKWVITLPKLTDGNASRAKADKLKQDGENLSAQEKTEIDAAVLAGLLKKRATLLSSMEDNRAKLLASIDKVKGAGIDPTKVAQPDGTTIDLMRVLKDFMKAEGDALSNLDGQIKSINPSVAEPNNGTFSPRVVGAASASGKSNQTETVQEFLRRDH